MFKLINDITNKQEARNLAIDYQNWQLTKSLSYGEISVYQGFFTKLGKRFNLLTEFKENGII